MNFKFVLFLSLIFTLSMFTYAQIPCDSLKGVYVGITRSHTDNNPWIYGADTVFVDSVNNNSCCAVTVHCKKTETND